MAFSVADWIGVIAACLTTGGWLPQAMKVIRTRQTRDISLLMQGIMVAGSLLWLIYGLVIASMPVIASNVLALPLLVLILVMKLRHG
jgi:MtN3 and saliva related transmembrane protein